MMYSEFIEISNFTEQYISFAEYTTCIEPIYMAADQIPTKQEFISLLHDAFKILVNPVVEKAIHNLSLANKLTYLEYANPRNAVPNHVSDEDKLRTQIKYAGQMRTVTIINESGLYSLILSSKLESAKTFKHWVTSEVLPTIRKTGGYIFVKNPFLKRLSVYSEHQKSRYF